MSVRTHLHTPTYRKTRFVPLCDSKLEWVGVRFRDLDRDMVFGSRSCIQKLKCEYYSHKMFNFALRNTHTSGQNISQVHTKRKNGTLISFSPPIAIMTSAKGL